MRPFLNLLLTKESKNLTRYRSGVALVSGEKKKQRRADSPSRIAFIGLPRNMNGNAQILAFQLDDRCFGLHLAQVTRVVRAVDATPLPHAPQIVCGAISIHGDVVPVLSMRRRLGLADREIGPDDQFIIARASRQSVALLVDRTTGVIERSPEDIVAAKSILPRLQQIEGVVRLKDDLLLIQDLDRFLSLDEQRELEVALTGAADHGR
jgi:purine-binding chemotaxis protein CheW